MKISTVVLCALGLFVNQCVADHYRERQRDREREEAQSLYCKDLNPQNQLDMEHVNFIYFMSKS